jgi:hypothetical protein
MKITTLDTVLWVKWLFTPNEMGGILQHTEQDNKLLETKFGVTFFYEIWNYIHIYNLYMYVNISQKEQKWAFFKLTMVPDGE